MAHQSPIRNDPTSQGSGIPDKLYFRIGEVARLCKVPAYVLRFWESEFPQLRPNKGGTGQRLFRQRDVEMALRIKCLLYDEGYTIPGARQLLKSEQKQKEPQMSLVPEAAGTEPTAQAEQLQSLRNDLRELLAIVSRPNTAGRPEPSRQQRGATPLEHRTERLFPFETAYEETGKDDTDE